jgi:hypothetical protein
MQEITLNALRLALPALDRYAVDNGPDGLETADDELLAQFEQLMPSTAVDPERQDDPGTADTADTAISSVGTRSMGSAGATVSQGGAEWQRVDISRAEPDDASSEFSVHHAKIGVVHVQQSSGRQGGSIMLRTDDLLLRERLRTAAADLQAAMTDASGRGPDVAIES